ncbi:MAG TPA: hypothetical protein VF017_07085 [Thermoanaerobaculia bacterium]|nr:hypothetical protein [Thermoanaerobaculia bacterium]
MIRKVLVGLSLFCFMGGPPGFAAEPPTVDPHLAPLAAFAGKTWRGNLAAEGKPAQWDVSRWEVVLKGKAIKTRHSVNEGAYGGESYIVWDEAKQSLVYFYFTNAGFYTTGTMTATGKGFEAREAVTGQADGITEVRSTYELLPDGRMRTRSEYLKNGEWVGGREAIYVEDPSATVVLD